MSTPQVPPSQPPAVRPAIAVLGFVFLVLPLAWAVWPDRPTPPPPAPAPAGTPASEMSDLDAHNYVAKVWTKYDELPEHQHTAEALGAVRLGTLAELRKLPAGVARDAIDKNDSEFRDRAARRIVRGDSYAKGGFHVTLVPSDNKAKCLLWGSQWANDAQTRANMRAMGFLTIECAKKIWRLDLSP